MTDAAAGILGGYERAGYERHPPRPVRAPAWDTTLFVSGGIQNWHHWALGAGAGARVGAQWCVRLNRLDTPGFLTSFCMVSGVRLGHRPRRDALAEAIGVLDAAGVAADRLAFVATAAEGDRPADDASVDALTALGVPADRVAMRPRKWAQPFRPAGPTGPNLFVLAETGPPCSPGCSPLCGCGRWLHFWNVELLDHVRDGHGRLAPAPNPACDSAGSLERLACALAGEPDPLRVEPLASAAAAVARLVPATDLVVDHGRTIALLAADGILPGGRAHGHVLRRLVRRLLAALAGAGADLALAGPVIRAAATGSAGRHGFPEHAGLPWLDAEVAAFRAVLARGRTRYARAGAAAASPEDLADAVAELHARDGVPVPVLLAWCRADGRTPSPRRLAELQERDRAVSRGAAR